MAYQLGPIAITGSQIEITGSLAIYVPSNSATGINENPTSDNVFWSFVEQDTNTEAVQIGWSAEVEGVGLYTVTNVEPNPPFIYITLSDPGLTLGYRDRVNFSVDSYSWNFNTGGTSDLPGDLNFSTSGSIRSIPSSSGDNLGAATLELRPDTSLGSDQYIVLDPTAPSHIHIRAGGSIDNSSAYLYLGGENNNVRVSDYGAVDISAVNAIRLKVPSYQFETFYDSDWSGSAEWVDVGGGQGQIIFNEPTLALSNLISIFGDYLSISASINSGNPIVVTSWGGGNPSNIYTATPPVTSPTVVTQIEFTLLFENRLRLDPDEGNIDFSVGDFNLILDSKRDINLYANDDLRLEGNDYVALRNTSATDPVRIITDYDSNEYEWRFNADGTTEMPGDVTISGSLDVSGSIKQNGVDIKPYKVYTALLTQNGGSNVLSLSSGSSLTIGITYTIQGYNANDDFSNVGGPPPVNESDYWSNYSFVATGTTPAVWTSTSLNYNTGAPVVTVLENTIGNVWFTYQEAGVYIIEKDGGWDFSKLYYNNGVGNVGQLNANPGRAFLGYEGNSFIMYTYDNALSPIEGQLQNTPIEIRVYN